MQCFENLKQEVGIFEFQLLLLLNNGFRQYFIAAVYDFLTSLLNAFRKTINY